MLNLKYNVTPQSNNQQISYFFLIDSIVIIKITYQEKLVKLKLVYVI